MLPQQIFDGFANARTGATSSIEQHCARIRRGVERGVKQLQYLVPL
jgi:hypothetical protein